MDQFAIGHIHSVKKVVKIDVTGLDVLGWEVGGAGGNQRAYVRIAVTEKLFGLLKEEKSATSVFNFLGQRMQKISAIIFDVDGTLAETEKYGHLPACNDAFAELGFPIRWTWEAYKPLLAIPGTPQRMKLALSNLDAGMSDEEVKTAVSHLYPLKNKFFIERYATQLPLRDGVESLIHEALNRGIRLAIVTQSDETQVNALLQHRLTDVADAFQPILGKQAGNKSAPDSPLYRRCLAELGTKPHETLVIEDTEAGLTAARTANLLCAVFYNEFSFGSSFPGAVLVAQSLAPFTLDLLTTLCMPDV